MTADIITAMTFTIFNKRFLKIINISFIEKIYFLILSSLFIYSIFNSIPTSNGSIGIAADFLQIGDRSFYINDSSLGYGYDGYHGNFLYPYILSLIIKIAHFFGQTSLSKFSNFLIISVTSLLSILSLRLLILSSKVIFNHGVSIYQMMMGIMFGRVLWNSNLKEKVAQV